MLSLDILFDGQQDGHPWNLSHGLVGLRQHVDSGRFFLCKLLFFGYQDAYYAMSKDGSDLLDDLQAIPHLRPTKNTNSWLVDLPWLIGTVMQGMKFPRGFAINTWMPAGKWARREA